MELLLAISQVDEVEIFKVSFAWNICRALYKNGSSKILILYQNKWISRSKKIILQKWSNFEKKKRVFYGKNGWFSQVCLDCWCTLTMELYRLSPFMSQTPTMFMFPSGANRYYHDSQILALRLIPGFELIIELSDQGSVSNKAKNERVPQASFYRKLMCSCVWKNIFKGVRKKCWSKCCLVLNTSPGIKIYSEFKIR